MLSQKLIIIMTKTFISASFLEDGRFVPLSFDGNTKMSYAEETNFQGFLTAVLETFNLEKLEDADMSAILVVCGSKSEKANQLNSILSKLKRNSMISVEYVLPYILLSKGELKKEGSQIVSIFDSFYNLELSEKNLLECHLTDEKDDAISLNAGDFFPLFFADASKFGADEKLLYEKDEEIKQLKDKIKEIEAKELEKENILACTKQLLEDSEHRAESIAKKMEIIAKRSIIYWKYEFYSEDFVKGLLPSFSRGYRFELSHLKKDDTKVNKGDEIAIVKGFLGRATVNCNEQFNLRAKSSGKIYYLTDEFKDIGVSAIIAVICDENESKEEVLKWCKEVLPNYLP